MRFPIINSSTGKFGCFRCAQALGLLLSILLLLLNFLLALADRPLERRA